MSTFDEAIASIRETYSKIGSSARADDYTVNKTIFVGLDAVRETVHGAGEKSFSNANLAILEDICNGTSVTLVRSTLVNLVAIYAAIIKKAPGYVVRNILNSMIVICNGKTTSNISRDCAVQVITAIMVHKANDCANQTNEIMILVGKLVRLTDLSLKVSCLKAVSGIIAGSGGKIGDVHAEMLKLAVRFSADKSVEVRVAVAEIMREISVNSAGFTTLPMDSVLNPASRGLEDETAIVQDAYAAAVSAIFCEQVNTFVVNQEQAKQGLARGSNSSKVAKKPQPLSQRMSITKLTMSTKKIVDEWDFRSVVTYVHKQLTAGSAVLRTGYLTVLGHLVRTLLDTLSPDDYEWLVLSTIEVLKDSPALRELTYEEQTYLRCRFSHFLRSSITSTGTEPQLLSFASLLIKHIITAESSAHSDLELQLVLNELCHVIAILGPAATALVEEANMGASLYLRHSNFGVRAAAAQVLGSLAVAVPVIATEFLRSALLNTQSQMKQLLQFDPVELTVDPEIVPGVVVSEAEQQQALAISRRRNSKEQERLQRVYFFHGHALEMSVLLKNAAALPTGLPQALVTEVYELGIDLMQQDVMSVPPMVRHVICSIVRSGSLIVASCLSMGFATAKLRLPQLIGACESILHTAAGTAAPPSTGIAHSNSSGSLTGQTSAQGGAAAKTDELVYEVMCVEAALVCFSTILRCCPEAMLLNCPGNSEDGVPSAGCFPNIIEGLETSYKLRTKYQPRLRTHFRFRTFHAMLLECFALLPPGSFPQSCQPIFLEALRVFRDGVAAGYETTLLSASLPELFSVVRVGAGQASACNISTAFQAYTYEAPMSEHLLMMKIEMHAVALEKKENEVFLSIFAKDYHPANVLADTSAGVATLYETSAAAMLAAPSAQLESRTIDAAVMLIGATFAHQSMEYQDKAVQLCANAVVQFAKASTKSMGLFSSTSDEDKRRKDRLNYTTLCTVLATFSGIIKSYPTYEDDEVVWCGTMVTVLYDMLAHSSYTLRCASASALAALSNKVRSGKVVEGVSSKIRGLMMSSLEKKVPDANAPDHSGYLVALSTLWGSATGLDDVQSLISTTVFDSLRKVSNSLPFRAQGLLTLSVFVRDFLCRTTSSDAADALDLLEKVIASVEAHISNLNFNAASAAISLCSDEVELFEVCLQRLLNVSCALSLSLYNSGLLDAERLHERFNNIRNGVFRDESSQVVRNETLNFFKFIIPVDAAAGKYTSYLLAWFRAVIDKRNAYSFEALNVALVALLPVLKKNPAQACEIGIDAQLFSLLDYCFSRTTVPQATAYTGLEIRKGALLGEDFNFQLGACISSTVQCIYALCTEDVRRSPDTRIIHWVLLCRCIALNTRSVVRPTEGGEGTEGNASAGGGGDRGDEDEEGGGARDSDFGGDAAASHAPGVYPVATINCTKFAAYCRERAIAHAPELDYCRVQLKCVAVRCILLTLAHIQGTAHSDVGQARAQTEQKLRAIKGKYTSPESLSSVPCYLPLFLTDVVNLCCACATYMIDDKPILMLQQESMVLMLQVVNRFLYTDDPDIKMAQSGAGAVTDSITEAVEGRILHQFTSQLLSAVRNGLANTPTLYCPDLLQTTGALLCSLIRGGYVSDKVVVRRLIKLVVCYCEQGGNINTSPSSSNAAAANNNDGPTAAQQQLLTIRAPVSQTVSEEKSTLMHLVHATVLAELFALVSGSNASDGAKLAFVASQVKSTVSSIVMEHSNVLSPLWYAMIVDASRVVYFEHHSANAASKSKADSAMGTLFGFTGDAADGDAAAKPEVTLGDTNPLRGGLTYSASAAALGVSAQSAALNADIRAKLLGAVPAVVAAYIGTCASNSKMLLSPKGKSSTAAAAAAPTHPIPAIDEARLVPLFAVAQSALRVALRNATPGATEQLLSSLLTLARRDSPAFNSGKSFSAASSNAIGLQRIPLEEWVGVVGLLNQHFAAVTSESTVASVAELVSVLTDRVVQASSESAPNADALWFGLWKLAILLVHVYDSRMLVNFDRNVWVVAEEVMAPHFTTGTALVQCNVHATCVFSRASAVVLVKTLTKLAAVKESLAPVVSNILALMLLSHTVQATSTDSEKDSKTLSELIITSLVAKSSTGAHSATLPALCVQLLQNAHDVLTERALEGNNVGGDTVAGQVLDVTLTAWRVVALSIGDKALLSPPYQLSSLILNTLDNALPTAALSAAVKFIQSYSGGGVQDVGCWTAGQLLPALLTRLSFSADSTEIRVLIIKALFLLFAVVHADQKSALLELFLTPMCAKIAENLTDSEFLLVCGRGLTHLARQEAETFRTQVPLLSDRHRTVLQGVMKLALQVDSGAGAGGFSAPQESGHAGSFGNASASGGAAVGMPAASGMTINMSKYKK